MRARTWIILGLVLFLVGFTGYQASLYLRSRQHYRAAEQALERRNFQEAGTQLEKCLDLWPSDLTAQLLAAQTARRRGDYEEAMRRLKICKQKQAPQDTLDLEYKLLNVQQGDLAEVGWLLRFCRDNPDSPETPLVLEGIIEATLELSTGRSGVGPPERMRLVPDVKPAIDLWCQIRRSQADQIQGLVWLGQFHSVEQDYARSVALFRQALERDPEHFKARLYLALSAVERNPQETLAHLEVLRQRGPDNSSVKLLLASVRRSLGQLEEARQLLDEVLTEQPDESAALLERGRLALDERQFDDAERWLRRALAQAPDVPEVSLTLSRCLQLKGRVTAAEFYRRRFQQLSEQQQQNHKSAQDR